MPTSKETKGTPAAMLSKTTSGLYSILEPNMKPFAPFNVFDISILSFLCIK